MDSYILDLFCEARQGSCGIHISSRRTAHMPHFASASVIVSELPTLEVTKP
jgi:hypothetical protein